MVKIRRKSNDALKRKIKEGIDTLSSAEVRVGWFNKEDAHKAQINEFGGITMRKKNGDKFAVPPRPFIFNKLKRGFFNIKNGSILGKRKVLQFFKDLGADVEWKIRKSIDDIYNPPISEITKHYRKKRGNNSDKPLIDTGNMRKNVKTKIVNKNAE